MAKKKRRMHYRVWVAHWPALHDPAPMALAVRDPQGRVVEFRGPPYEYKGWEGSPAGKLHNALMGPHASVLHAGDAADVLEHHEDYEAVHKLYEESV